jgi:hypothetical protein
MIKYYKVQNKHHICKRIYSNKWVYLSLPTTLNMTINKKINKKRE